MASWWKGCPDLIHLMEEGEVKEDFYQLPAEEILLRWFNHHLRSHTDHYRCSPTYHCSSHDDLEFDVYK